MQTFVITTLISFVVASAGASSLRLTPNSFSTRAEFAVDKRSLSRSSVVATIEPRVGAPGYSWVRLQFYSFLPTDDDLKAIANGNVKSMDDRWMRLADKHDGSYSHSHSTIQLSVDENFKVWQVDMSIPGHSCTIAPYEPQEKKVLEDYRFDGNMLRLKSKGSHNCKQVGNFFWDINLETRVFEKR